MILNITIWYNIYYIFNFRGFSNILIKNVVFVDISNNIRLFTIISMTSLLIIIHELLILINNLYNSKFKLIKCSIMIIILLFMMIILHSFLFNENICIRKNNLHYYKKCIHLNICYFFKYYRYLI